MQMVAFQLFLEVAFYWSHRALHHPALYKHLHKQHHEYKGTIGFAAEYASVGEQVCRWSVPSAANIVTTRCAWLFKQQA